MNVDEIVEDPLYQLNLTLWLLQPLRDGYPLNPLLREAGYELFAISPGMPLGPALRETVTSGSVDSAVEPGPDLLLSRDERGEFVVWECKSQLFGAESSSARQARGLLLQAGEQFNLAIGLELKARPDLYLVYLSKHLSCQEYLSRLCSIKHDLELKGMKTLPVGGIGIVNRDIEVCLHNAYDQGMIPPALANIVGTEAKVQDLASDENPIPLFYIPWDPNVSQSDVMKEHCESVFGERILSAFVAEIGRASTPVTLEVVYDDLLNKATFHFYSQWRSKDTQRALRRRCKQLIDQALEGAQAHFERSPLVQPSKPGVSLKIGTDEDLECIIDSITKCQRGAWITTEPEPQLSLFPEDDGV